ncbi:protein mono-ADP-ribosyltransferase PARP11-like [Hyalella azteca]|uniref:Poly [ADP-ribose] polymerase n=1 Tax=Hyalella azteca TaxID=294128 RepID=A0A979FPZ2_HYAAZ|nr:protein mono-ADP-ribosyltransferase PARP11-like [Hyalella azteca]
MKQTNTRTLVTKDVRRVYSYYSEEHLLQTPNGPPEQARYSEAQELLKPVLTSSRTRSIFKINNPYLKTAFENKKAQLQHQNPNVQYEVKWLFHGTSSSNVTSIADENIDWRLHGTKTGQLYGRGAYFASQASDALRYGDVIFICHVLVGLTATGSPDTIKPPKDRFNRPIDTTVDNTVNPTIFVKYDSQEYYPVYYELF